MLRQPCRTERMSCAVFNPPDPGRLNQRGTLSSLGRVVIFFCLEVLIVPFSILGHTLSFKKKFRYTWYRNQDIQDTNSLLCIFRKKDFSSEKFLLTAE